MKKQRILPSKLSVAAARFAQRNMSQFLPLSFILINGVKDRPVPAFRESMHFGGYPR